ncbi:PREDICTED: mRNA-decapping enzyme-like protein [Nelumbo nucifera]|uniref:mRNA-decapping enzyme-like protein n=1 Tax=Nelumbo nucifera TaxID=4432 RepID=A0A1U8BB48_NELNU|nr:PREDICTED: mRNA-decapping enzyme-like protein [Nelumbo nucifera]
MNIGNTPGGAISGQLHQSSATIPLSSHTPSVVPSPVPALQMPSALPASSTPIMPLLDTTESNGSNRATNLVKPSSFFTPPPSSSALLSPISSMSTAPPLHPAVNLQCPYGTPLLQPFPPPTPPPSLTPAPAPAPAPNYGPVINRDKVRDALLRLVQVRQIKRITRYTRTYLVRNFGLRLVNATGEASLVSVGSSWTTMMTEVE